MTRDLQVCSLKKKPWQQTCYNVFTFCFIFPDFKTELCFLDSSSSNKETTGLGDASIEVLHVLLSHILTLPKEEKLLTEEQIELFLNSLRKDFPKERVPVILSPLLYSKKYHQEDTPFVADLDIGTSLNLNKVNQFFN